MTDTTSTFDFIALIDGVSRTHAIRVVTLEGKPWFVAKDICSLLFNAERVRIHGVTKYMRSVAPDERRVLGRERLISHALIVGHDKTSAAPSTMPATCGRRGAVTTSAVSRPTSAACSSARP
jgi:hypothetical protein